MNPTNSMTPADHTLYTIGHSNHALEVFLTLIAQHQIDTLGDVRSSPYSKYNPQFNREAFASSLAQIGVQYAYWGNDLGARQLEEKFLAGGQVDFGKYTQSAKFQTALSRLRSAVPTSRIALMCAEKDPITCHRTILVTRALRKESFNIRHIREDGSLETPEQAERRLLKLFDLPPGDLLSSEAELVQLAYDKQAKEIAFVLELGDISQK
jgi:uncharacterized protein (DUF488 family)